jgi:HAD superfamily hydrolase (TIGR01484 family)
MNFVFDLDGTLCFDGKTIDSSIIDALYTLNDAGHTVIFASARPIRDLLPLIPTRFQQGLLIGGNGCFTSVNQQVSATFLDNQIRIQLEKLITAYKLSYLADSDWDFAYTGSLMHPIYHNIDQTSAKNKELQQLDKICKLVLFNPPYTVIDAIQQLPVTITPYKTEQAIDIGPLNIHKVAGLHKLDIHDFIAFGNDANDQCLFEQATYSVCVGNHDVSTYASIQISKEEVAQTILNVAASYTSQ